VFPPKTILGEADLFLRCDISKSSPVWHFYFPLTNQRKLLTRVY